MLSYSLREEGWRWIAERRFASENVPEGGHISIFSLFLSVLFCLKIVSLRVEGVVRLSMSYILAFLCFFKVKNISL